VTKTKKKVAKKVAKKNTTKGKKWKSSF
jgi:hypothetical protein